MATASIGAAERNDNDRHHDACEDERLACSRTRRPVQRRCRDGPSDGHAFEHAGRDVRDSLPYKISRGIGIASIGVGEVGRYTRALHEADERERCRRNQKRRHEPEVGKLRPG